VLEAVPVTVAADKATYEHFQAYLNIPRVFTLPPSSREQTFTVLQTVPVEFTIPPSSKKQVLEVLEAIPMTVTVPIPPQKPLPHGLILFVVIEDSILNYSCDFRLTPGSYGLATTAGWDSRRAGSTPSHHTRCPGETSGVYQTIFSDNSSAIIHR
jgi:hypothetical protein